ncbi:50S ribosomal protein L6 [Candidatus Kaiserbacteria bacterium RIFCSPLOWO2_01_FULL_54_20]|uniref:Large ribosomal subunit protein uL6 n=1 Tax=Candidatus Kaiserbacteria bacterium RIFCSPLOWO2_01_FULL_54_20 TaxID=1798513 RepID=A0A1F6EKB2_9BACT|nr:MAG: 50S ribosomal protein L6 [Candidatus Kaiserbacteria bacterium RIFCSPLOWO2_01_FULL_54_20]
MSRIGKRAIPIPAGTEVSVADSRVTVKAKGGTLKRSIHPEIVISVSNGEVAVSPARETRLARALWGTYAAHVRNMIEGVNKPFVKKLLVEGIGYKAELAGKQLKLAVGFSHPILIAIPDGLTVAVDKNIITVSGADREQVGQFSASVRAVKKPEPYKGKGIRYENEVVRRKQGKKAATAAAA